MKWSFGQNFAIKKSLVYSSATAGQQALTETQFHLNVRKNLFVSVRVTEQWHRLPRGCGVPSLEAFSSRLDVGLGTPLWVSLLSRAGADRPGSPFQP